jgi:hypothetical protein
MIVWQVTNSTAAAALSPDAFYTLLGAIVGAILGFFLFVVYDERKDRKLNEAERKRVLSLLAIESTENFLRGNEIIRILKQEIASISSNAFAFMASPPHLCIDGWTIAKAGNLLKHAGERNLQRWILAYSNIAIANNNLECRDLLKATLTTSLNYQHYLQNVSTYDQTIVDGLTVVLERLQEAMNTLPNEVRVPLSTAQP